MTQIGFLSNFNVTYGLADFSLAGRIPPIVTPNQLRPNLINPRKLIENRKYSDNPIQPYVSTYDLFSIPITFEVDPIEEAIAAAYNTIPTIVSVTGRMTNCVFESPLPQDGDKRTEVDSKGKIVTKGIKLASAGSAIWSVGAFQEPYVLGPSNVPEANRMDNPLGVTYSTPGSFVGGTGFGSGNVGGFGESVTYTFGGYFTERNFFDREWIVQWGKYFVKIDCFGVYVLKPTVTKNPLSVTDPTDWVSIGAWTPDEFYQRNISLANKFDGPVVETFISGAKEILKYKPSEIGSLRYYFVFTTETLAGPFTLTSTHLANLTVKYNQDTGAERLRFTQLKLNRKRTTLPEWLLTVLTTILGVQ